MRIVCSLVDNDPVEPPKGLHISLVRRYNRIGESSVSLALTEKRDALSNLLRQSSCLTHDLIRQVIPASIFLSNLLLLRDRKHMKYKEKYFNVSCCNKWRHFDIIFMRALDAIRTVHVLGCR